MQRWPRRPVLKLVDGYSWWWLLTLCGDGVWHTAGRWDVVDKRRACCWLNYSSSHQFLFIQYVMKVHSKLGYMMRGWLWSSSSSIPFPRHEDQVFYFSYFHSCISKSSKSTGADWIMSHLPFPSFRSAGSVVAESSIPFSLFPFFLLPLSLTQLSQLIAGIK